MRRLVCDTALLELIGDRAVSELKGYPSINVEGVRTYLHHLVLPVKAGFDVDHKNRNKWDCRSENLRYLTHSDNLHNVGLISSNKSGYRGVSRQGAGWAATLTYKGKSYRAPTVFSITEAVQHRNEMEIKYLPERLRKLQ